jgi:hypothetical protein
VKGVEEPQLAKDLLEGLRFEAGGFVPPSVESTLCRSVPEEPSEVAFRVTDGNR